LENSQKKLIPDLNLIEEENNEELDFYNLLSMRQKENESFCFRSKEKEIPIKRND
jgi:hypothetical protein